MQELISVIVPIYNVEKYINRCIDSIISQTYKNLEIILVNDGSPDNCSNICKEYSKIDVRIKIINKDNGGLSDARNVGLKNSTGEYIVFIDSDDYVDRKMIETLYKKLKEDNSDIALCDFAYVNENGSLINELNKNTPIRNEVMDPNEYFHKMCGNKYWYYIVVWNKIYKKSLFSNIKFPIGRMNEDDYIIHRIICECKKVTSVSDKLYFYVQRQGSIMSNSNNIKRLDIVEAYLDRTCFYLENGYYEQAKCTFKSALLRWEQKIESIFWDNEFKSRNKEIHNIYKKCYRSIKCKNINLGVKVKLKSLLVNYSPNLYLKSTKIIRGSK